MATLKHLSSKNADYGAAEQYLTFEHDELTGRPVLDKNGRLVPRQDYRISSLNCGGEDFAVACMRANLRYGKNQRREDVKSHHYILSFDPRDGPDHGLTMDKAQALGERFCTEQFPGHQALVCTHPDGHNHSGNIHVHIVINSLRVEEVERKPYMDRASDTQAGAKHRCTAAAMRHFRAEVMELCQEAGLYQIDLLGGSKNRVTEREYWAQKKGQLALDKESTAQGNRPLSLKRTRRNCAGRSGLLSLWLSASKTLPSVCCSGASPLRRAGAGCPTSPLTGPSLSPPGSWGMTLTVPPWALLWSETPPVRAGEPSPASGSSFAKLKPIELALKEKKELRRQVAIYRNTKAVREGLAAQKAPKARAAYQQEHEADLLRSEAAVRFFKANGITKLPSTKELTAEIETLMSEKNAGYTEYQERKRKADELMTVKRNIDQVLHGAPSQRRDKHDR